MTRCSLTILFLPLIAACGLQDPDLPSAGPSPNVLLIVLDTTRADALSSYGRPKETTPTIDQLAAEGARFTQAFTTDFYTLPAHASIMTGLQPSDHHATSETGHLPADQTTLAERLHVAGFRTAGFVSNAWLARGLGFAQGFETYVESWRPDPQNPTRILADRGSVLLAREWITERVGAQERFFAFLNLNQAHLPYYPNTTVLNRLSPHPRPMERVLRLRDVTSMWRQFGGRQSFDALDFEIMNERYEAEVAMLDALVAMLVSTLTDLGVVDETLIIITSDHGENIGDHGLIDHMLSMYDTTIRVPLVIRYPARVPAGTVFNELVSLVDIYSTVLDACGLERDGPTPGRSLLDSNRKPLPYVIAENERPINGIKLLTGAYPEFDVTPIDRRMRMLRTARHKLIWRDGLPSELYDLVNDPDEEVDISAAQPKVTEELERLLAAHMSTYEPQRGADSLRIPDEQTLDQLRALGYVE